MFFGGVCLLSDVPFTLLLWTAIGCWLLESRSPSRGCPRLLIAGACLIAACWVRTAGFVLAPFVLLGAVAEKSPNLGMKLATICLTAVGVVASAGVQYQAATAPSSPQAPEVRVDGATPAQQVSTAATRPTVSYVPTLHSAWSVQIEDAARVVRDNLTEFGEHWFRLFTGQKAHYLVALVVFLPFACIGGCEAWRRGSRLLPLITTGYLVLLAPWLSLSDRHLMPVAPALFLFFISGVELVVAKLAGPRHGRNAALFAFGLCLAASMVRDVGLAMDRRWPQQSGDSERFADIRATAAKIREHTSADGVFVATKHGRELAYLSQRPSSPHYAPKIAAAADLAAWYAGEIDALAVYRQGVVPHFGEVAAVAAAYVGHELVYENEHFKLYIERSAVAALANEAH